MSKPMGSRSQYEAKLDNQVNFLSHFNFHSLIIHLYIMYEITLNVFVSIKLLAGFTDAKCISKLHWDDQNRRNLRSSNIDIGAFSAEYYFLSFCPSPFDQPISGWLCLSALITICLLPPLSFHLKYTYAHTQRDT